MTFLRTALMALLIVGLASCSGGYGGGSVLGVSAQGHWMQYITITGDPNGEIGPSGGYISQNGTSLNGVDQRGTLIGTLFTITTNENDLTGPVDSVGTLSGDTASGTFVMQQGVPPIVGTFRMTRFMPVGTMVANGTVGGGTVNINATDAFCERHYTDVALTQLDAVVVKYRGRTSNFDLDISASGLQVGTLVVGTDIFVDVEYETDAAENSSFGLTGTLDITQFDATGIAGTFNINLAGGGSVSGSFSCPINPGVLSIDAYYP